MAKTLSEVMSQNQSLNPSLGGVDDQKEKISKLLRAKSGKAVGGGTGPASSNIQEQIAAQQVRDQAAQIQTGATLQAQQFAQATEAQQEQHEAERQASQEQAKLSESQFERARNNIFNELERNFDRMDMQEREDVFRTAAAMARLSNKQYVHKLTTAARHDRIDSEAAWKRKFAEVQAADTMKFFRNNMMHASVLFEEKMQFAAMMDDMSIDQAMEIAEMDIKQQQAQMVAQGLSTAASAGASTYAMYEADPTAKALKDDPGRQGLEGTESGIDWTPELEEDATAFETMLNE